MINLTLLQLFRERKPLHGQFQNRSWMGPPECNLDSERIYSSVGSLVLPTDQSSKTTFAAMHTINLVELSRSFELT